MTEGAVPLKEKHLRIGIRAKTLDNGDFFLTGGFAHVFFFLAEGGIRDDLVTGVQTCALPISERGGALIRRFDEAGLQQHRARQQRQRSEEHTSELQSPDHLVCRLLLEKK